MFSCLLDEFVEIVGREPESFEQLRDAGDAFVVGRVVRHWPILGQALTRAYSAAVRAKTRFSA